MWVTKPNTALGLVLNIIGSVPLITGFAFVLYSRLHFVLPLSTKRRWKLRGLLIMIIVNAVLFSLPSIVATLLGHVDGSILVSYRMYKVVVYFEIAFVLEDIILEILYLFYFWQYLRDVPAYVDQTAQKHMKRTFHLLLKASLVVLVCDLLGLVLFYMKILLLKYVILGILYGIKLNTEFFVLNRLVEMVKMKDEILKRGNMSVGAVLNEITNSAIGNTETKYSSAHRV
jgi:hypothetical protein